MTSLHQLLTQEGFTRGSGRKHHPSFRTTAGDADDDSALNFKSPMYIRRDPAANEKSSSSRKDHPSWRRRASVEINPHPDSSPEMDQIAVKAVVSILSGYVGRYANDSTFRRSIREKCNSCLARKSQHGSEDRILTNMRQAVESIDEALIQNRGAKDSKLKSLKNSIQLLTIVGSLNSEKSRRDGFTGGGIPNSYLSSCAQLYLSIVYKLERNDRISAIHLLQTFCDAPLLARTHLLPDLWEHFFLPNLLHLKVWYHEELEYLSTSNSSQSSEKGLKSLCKAYNERMDLGTVQFALYYKNWLKIGVKAPSVPDVPLPWKQSSSTRRRRRSSIDSCDSHLSINRSLYEYVLGRTPPQQSKENDSKDCNDLPDNNHDERSISVSKRKENCSKRNEYYSPSEIAVAADSSYIPRQDYLKLFSCKSMVAECLADGKLVVRNSSFRNPSPPSNGLTTAVDNICTSDVLSDCEAAIREIAATWLNSRDRDPTVESARSRPPVIESMLEILYVSADEEVLELIVSLLADLAARREMNRLTVLNYDPQLEIFIKLMKSSSLFLKASTLLYQLRPMAKQMISAEWVALVLRVLEFGDQTQVLFDVTCVPHEAALYFLEQLMTGFDEDKNLENSCQVVSLGGLSLLVRRFEVGDFKERNEVAMLMCSCMKAVGSCRNYLAENLSKRLLLKLISSGMRKRRRIEVFGFKLLTELLCLSRRTLMIKLLTGIRGGFEGLNAMDIFLAYLERASADDRPLVAAVLLQLDLLGDPKKHGVYREEAVEALADCLDCERCDSEAQEQTARALLMMGGRFSYEGESTVTTEEEWLFQETLDPDDLNKEEEEATEKWQRKLATALLNSGGRRFLTALSGAVANGVPNLAQASLFTVSWINKTFLTFGDDNLVPVAHSILLSQLGEQNRECSSQFSGDKPNPRWIRNAYSARGDS